MNHSAEKNDAPLTLEGRLELRLLQPNSKNRQMGVYLVNDEGAFLIRPAATPGRHNPFEKLAGSNIKAYGRLRNGVFLADQWQLC